MSKIERKKYVDMTQVVKAASGYTVDEVAYAVQAQAVSNAPSVTGYLRGSISVKSVSEKEAEVYSNVEYAIYQEFGTRNMQAAMGGKGYMRPAVDNIRKRLAKYWRAAFKEAYASNKR